MTKPVLLASRIGAPVLLAAIAAAAVCAGLALAGRAPSSVAVGALVVLFVTIGIGVGLPSSGVFARPVLRAQTGRPEVALTFDDGPHPLWTPPILDLLESRGHRATFFVVGARASENPGLLTDMARRGHEIANHTWRHSYATVWVNPRVLADELDRASNLVERATGSRPHWFRPPVGLLSPRIAPALRLAGLRLVAWTASARDGVRHTTVQKALSRLDSALTPGAILVLHDAPLRGDAEPIARSVLGPLLDRMDALGLRSVTLSELCTATGDDGQRTSAGSPLAPATRQANLKA